MLPAPVQSMYFQRRTQWCALLLTCVLVLAGCGEKIEPILGSDEDSGVPAVPEPLRRWDLDDLRRSGILKVATYYSPRTYFIHKGGQAGFEFELVSRFAEQQGLTLEMVIAEPGDDLVSLLNTGQADLVCVGHTVPPGVEPYLAWTRPTNFTRKVVVLPETSTRPATLEGLAGLTLTLPQGCPFEEKLQAMRQEAGMVFRVVSGPPLAEAEDLMAQVANGEREAIVVDDIAARAGMAWIPGLKLGPILGEPQATAWLMRNNSTDLKGALDSYLQKHLKVTSGGRTRRSQTYGIIHDRYFRNEKSIKGYRDVNHRPDKSGRISRYDELVRTQAEAAGLDWRLVSALMYQESRFYPNARSKADARGLMQVLPQFAGPQADSLYIPEANLRAGLRLMKQTYQNYAYLDSLDRWRFTLAEYHAGHGHVTDARRMAMDMGRDPNSWGQALKITLPRLMESLHYRRTRHGYYGGAETVDYVEEIMNRFRMYARFVPRQPEEPDSMEEMLKNLQLLPGLVTTTPGPPPR